MINLPVLVLNQNYEPLTVCRARRAIVLMFEGKAEMLENGMGFIHSSSRAFPLPSVIRLDYFVRRPYRQRKMSRFEIFNRDDYICQYCGLQSHSLTLDHVIPRFRGGPHTWENVVSACVACNRKKAGRTPKEAGMKLKRVPSAPRDGHFFRVPHQYITAREEWRKYLLQ